MPLPSEDLLYEWRAPKTFARVLAGLRATYGAEHLFTVPVLNRSHRELWGACEFCKKSSTRKVRMTRVDAKSSDFEVMLRDGTLLMLQFAETDVPGRRRGDEYRARVGLPTRIEADPYSEWVARRDKIPEALENCIRKKATKGYASDVSLLIYLNISTYGEWSTEIKCEMIAAARKFGSGFRSVWVIWSNNLYRAWPNPSAGMSGPMFAGGHVRLGRWRERWAAQREFYELFD